MALNSTRRSALASHLTQGFSAFLRRRGVLRHFARTPLPHTHTGSATGRSVPSALAGDLLQVAKDSPADALARLGSGEGGLDPREAAARLVRDGPNEVAHEQPVPGWLHLWHCYRNPFNLLLTVLAVVSYLGADAKATTVIGVMVVFSTVVRFVQEGRSHRAAESLRALVTNTATVLRQRAALPAVGEAGARQEIPMRALVAGDLVALSAGDMVPADCRVLTARDLFIAQAAMTGESAPVEKFPDRRADTLEPLAQSNLVFMGTNVVSGSASALVVRTGNRSYFGTVAASVLATDPAPNAFQAGVNSVSWLLIRFALVMVPIVLLVNGFTKGDWPEAVLFALSVAVGLTPEMLPMVVTATLAKGAVALSRRKVVVKRLDAIQNFGAMDVLCTDKTGTLTQDRIAPGAQDRCLRRGLRGGAGVRVPEQLLPDRAQEPAGPRRARARGAARHAAAPAALPQDRRVALRLRAAAHVGGGLRAGRAPRTGLQGRGRGGAGGVHPWRMPAAGNTTGVDAPLDAGMLQRVQQCARALGEEGLRVVAVAMKEMPPDQAVYTLADEAGLTLIGYIAFLDPPKESAAPALQALAAHGIQVKVLTGDNDTVTTRVCRQVGLATGTVLLGAQVESMDGPALAQAVEQHQLFAKLSPLHKERIVGALRANGHVVGFLGDGINDAPALRAADIGISVDSAVDIAKEAADIILLEKSLMVLDDGVIEGRTTFCNMLKYIRMTASSNFGNVLSVLVASVFLPFLPMLPLQLLLQNLLYDVSQTGIPFDRVDAEQVARPLQWNPGGIGRFMVFFGPVSALFDVATFALMWWVFGADTVAEQGLFQSGWFVVGLLTQTLVVHMVRTPRLPFVRKPRGPAAGGDDAGGHGHRHLPADGPAGRFLQAAGATARVLRLAGCHPGRLLPADDGPEALLHPALRLAVSRPAGSARPGGRTGERVKG
jgi:Mg2+-importing ATPase